MSDLPWADPGSPLETGRHKRRWPWIVLALVVLSGGAGIRTYFAVGHTPVSRIHGTSSRTGTSTMLLSASGAMPLPTGSPPAPQLAELVPTNAQVASETWVRLNGIVPQVVVTYDEPSSSAPNGTAKDLMLLAWDKFAKRWVAVFDAAKTPQPGSETYASTGTTEAILSPNADIFTLSYSTIIPIAGQTDFAFWDSFSFGANAPFGFYIVHYDGQNASLVYNGGGENGSAQVVGDAPNQRLSVTLQWTTAVDAMCCPVRNYTQQIGWMSPTTVQGVTESGGFGVLSDNRSWLGVFVADEPGQDGATPPPPIVMTVVPGSPSDGILKPGDELLSVAGATPHNAEGGIATLGPEVIDEVATEMPGSAIVLSIERGGQQIQENINLSSYANPDQIKAIAPTPGLLGVEVETDSTAIQSDYGLGTSQGAYITTVDSGSAADQAGLVGGDVITEFNGYPVTDTHDLSTAVLLSPAFSTASITYVDSGGASRTLNVEMSPYPPPSSGSTIFPPAVVEM